MTDLKLRRPYRGFTAEDDKLVLSDEPVKIIARRLGRTPDSIKARRKYLRRGNVYDPKWNETRKRTGASIGSYVSHDLYMRLSELADRRRTSMSALVREAVEAYLETGTARITNEIANLSDTEFIERLCSGVILHPHCKADVWQFLSSHPDSSDGPHQ